MAARWAGRRARCAAFERPKETPARPCCRLLRYLEDRRLALVVVFVLMLVSTGSMLAGTTFSNR